MKLIIRWKMAPQRLNASAVLSDFRSPLPQLPRTAILTNGFRCSRQVRVFPDGFTADAASFEPELIAGGIKVLRALARTVREGVLSLPSVRYAVVVLTEIDGELLSPQDRDLLWDAFGVPIYEQLIGPRMETLASECEAHQGLHVIHPDCPSEHLATMLSATIETSPCACGAPGVRLLARPDTKPVVSEIEKAAAKAA